VVEEKMIHVVSVRVGDRYSPDYVHKLHDGIVRHTQGEQRHWCLTDRPDELVEGITPILAFPGLPGWWQKVFLFSRMMPWAEGDEVLYMDLDVCITGRLDDLPHGIIRDWHWPCYNSSVMRWRHGDHRAIWDRFTLDVIDRPSESLKDLLPAGQINGGDQEWISQVSAWDTFPADWFVSYRNAVAWPPDTAKAVILHGSPKPHEVTDGWVPHVWKVGGYTALPTMDGMNVSHDFALDNVRTNAQRDLPWFTGFDGKKAGCAIVGGGPSMKDSIPQIRYRKARGDTIITLNNALTYLVGKGITPDAHVMLDARPENAEFIKDAPKGVRYFIASQCHPDVFEALKDHDVTVWHNGFGSGESMMEILAPWFDEGPNQRPVVLVPGGGTVGLRTMCLTWLSGYKRLHLYGFDSSYEEDNHHAYSQALNDTDNTMTVAFNDKHYKCAPWMVRQANEFKDAYSRITADGVNITVHGRGLIPDIYKQMKGKTNA